MIGENIKHRREELGIRAGELARLAGVSPATISMIETGKREPSSTTIYKVAHALGVEPSDLLPLDVVPEIPLSEHERVMAGGKPRAFFMLPEEDEEPDVVTLRFNMVRLMDENDRLLRRVRDLEKRVFDGEARMTT